MNLSQPSVRQIVTKSGTTYRVGDPWPGADGDSQGRDSYKVGFIFYIPASEVPAYDDDDNCVQTLKTPGQFEVWCMTDRLMQVYQLTRLDGERLREAPKEIIDQLKQDMSWLEEQSKNGMGMTKRIVRESLVDGVDEQYLPQTGFEAIDQRFLEQSGIGDQAASEKANGQAQPQAAQPQPRG